MQQPPPYNQWQQPQWPPQQPPPIQYPPPYQQPYYPLQAQLPPNWLELERQRAAAGRSYTNKAMFTLLLYLFLWIPGLIANLLYLGEAYETKKLTGTAPDGWGCLWLMLVIALSPVLLVCVGFLFASLGVGH